MRKLINFGLILLAICRFPLTTFAQGPEAIPYQAVARDASGNLISNHTIALRFTILQGSVSGTIVYQETQSATTNDLGLFTVNILQGVVTTVGPFNPIDWQVLASLGAFIKVEMDISGAGLTYTDMGTTQMLSVPFALYSKIAGSTPGAVTYKGTWNASTNSPNLASSTGTKGFYYVVSDADVMPSSNTTLNGINDWGIGDWAIYNGTIWEKVDNTGSVTDAEDVQFASTPGLPATNVQDAIEEVASQVSTKVDRAGDTMTGSLILNANPSSALGAATKQYVDAGDATLQSQVSTKVNKAGDTMTGNLVLNADPTSALGAATKQYVDAGDATLQSQVSTKVNKAGDTMTGNLVLNANPTSALGAATKQYVDAGDATLQSQVSTKVNKAGDTMTGNLVLNANPSSALGAATKQYVDAGDATLQSQVNTKVNKAGDTMTGNLVLNADPTSALGAATKQYVDAGDATLQSQVSTKVNKAGDTMTGNLVLNADPTAVLGAATKQYVDAGDAAMQSDFSNLLDSYIHQVDDNVTIYLAPGSTFKRFGIGDTAPSGPLGIKAETGQDDKMICFTTADASQKWNINLNPTSNDAPGFSIDNSSTGVSQSRLFIDQTNQGNVGVGTVTPQAKLHIHGANDGGDVSVFIENEASMHGGWKMGHIDDNSITERNGAFGIFEKTSSGLEERITILGSKNVGVNETLPDVTLHVSRPALEPNSELTLLPGTGIVVVGPIADKHLVMDSKQIQARTGEYVSGGPTLSFSALNLQPMGGPLIIHANSALVAEKLVVTVDGNVGVGTITPHEKVEINGAIMVGNTTGSNDGTIRYNGSDFEGRKGGSWVSLTGEGSGFTNAGAGMISYNVANPKVGIGVAVPTASLHVSNTGVVTSGIALTTLFTTECSSFSVTPNNRIGVKIENTGTWSSSPAAKDIGLYVSNVSGQSSSHSNIGALVNGNVVIGDLTSSSLVGNNGSKVLAIQTGTAPSSQAGSSLTSNGGIQIYSDELPGSASTFHVMNGDGTVIQLYRTPALPAQDNSTVGSTYDTNAQNVINNLRSRIDALELRLQALGLLTP